MDILHLDAFPFSAVCSILACLGSDGAEICERRTSHLNWSIYSVISLHSPPGLMEQILNWSMMISNRVVVQPKLHGYKRSSSALFSTAIIYCSLWLVSFHNGKDYLSRSDGHNFVHDSLFARVAKVEWARSKALRAHFKGTQNDERAISNIFLELLRIFRKRSSAGKNM